MRKTTIALIIILALASGLPAGADWPMAGYDPARSNATSAPGPTAGNLLWSFSPTLPPDHRSNYHYPAVADGLVYWSGCEYEFDFLWTDYYGMLRCFDSTTGMERWSLSRDNRMGSPTIYNGRLYVTGSSFDPYYGITFGSRIYCLEAETGSEIWSRNFSEIQDSPVITDGVIVSTRVDDDDLHQIYECWIFALDAATGSALWQHREYGEGRYYIRPAVADGRVFSGWGDNNYVGIMACFDLRTGSLIWQKIGTGSNPIVCAETVIYEVNDNPMAFDVNTGALQWTRSDMDMYRIAAADGRLYITETTGRLSCLDLETGTTQWSVPTSQYMNVAIAANRLYLTPYLSSNTAYCLDTATGGTLWSAPVDSTLGSTALSDGKIYTSSLTTLTCLGNTEDPAPFGARIDGSLLTGQLPLDVVSNISLTNFATQSPRRYDFEIDLVRPDGTGDRPWRRGYQNVMAGETWNTSFTLEIPGLGDSWGTWRFELTAVDVTPPPWNQSPYPASGWTTTDSSGVDVGLVGASLSCEPSAGTMPFVSQFAVGMTNRYIGQTRQFDYTVNVTTASGQFYSNWRRGYQNVGAGLTYTKVWNQTIPAYGTLDGINRFDLEVLDITPAPYNQPPYPPAGDMATDSCEITAVLE